MIEILFIILIIVFFGVIVVGFISGGFISYILLKKFGKVNGWLIAMGSFFWGLFIIFVSINLPAIYVTIFTGVLGFIFLAIPPIYYYLHPSIAQDKIPMQIYAYRCRKCWTNYTTNYTVEEYEESKFCWERGTLLQKPAYWNSFSCEKYPTNWNELRKQALERAGYRCEQCGRTGRLHVHHIIPVSEGGSHDLSNLMVLCPHCHSKMHPGNIWLERMAEEAQYSEYNDYE